MTYREALKKERRWQRRVIIINLYHNHMLLKKKQHWTMRMTAARLEVSLGMVSESIKLAKAICDDPSLELMKREDALHKIKNPNSYKSKQFTKEQLDGSWKTE